MAAFLKGLEANLYHGIDAASAREALQKDSNQGPTAAWDEYVSSGDVDPSIPADSSPPD